VDQGYGIKCNEKEMLQPCHIHCPIQENRPIFAEFSPPSKEKRRLSHIPTISPNFDTNYIICRKFEKFKKKNSSKEQKIVKGKENLFKYSGMFYFQHGIFKINQLFDRLVQAAPLL
jgi:hypothetical protein